LWKSILLKAFENGGKAMWKKNIRNEIYTILFGTVMALIIIFWPKQVMAEEYYRPV